MQFSSFHLGIQVNTLYEKKKEGKVKAKSWKSRGHIIPKKNTTIQPERAYFLHFITTTLFSEITGLD